MTPQNKLYEAAKKARTRLGQLKVRTTGTKTVILDMDDYQVVMDVYSYLDQIISAYEQEQPEAIAGENEYKLSPEITLKREFNVNHVLNLYCGYRHITKDGDYVLPDQYDKVITAMEHFASQQTSAKDKEIAELKQRISVIKEKLPDNKIRELNPIWVRDEIISELEKLI